MLGDYEKLRQEQLIFIEEYYKNNVEPKGHFCEFWLSDNAIYSLRIDDLTSFANKYNLTFNYDYVLGGICFKSINRDMVM